MHLFSVGPRFSIAILLSIGVLLSTNAVSVNEASAGELPNAQLLPNVLLISIDDLNDGVGRLGGHPHAKAPGIDRLAAQRTLFTNAHCWASGCHPSRASVMTGR